MGGNGSGRNPKPAVSVEHPRGKYRKDPTASKGKISFPEGLCSRAKEVYEIVSAQAEADAITGLLDQPLMFVFCQTYAEWERATKQMQASNFMTTTEKGGSVVNPLLWAVCKLAFSVAKIGSELGLSPIGRARIGIELSRHDDDTEAYIKRRLERVKQ